MSAIAAGVYALWLAAGWLDFHFHRRTDLPHTSAMRESLLHGVQLLLIGSGVLAWLLLENTLSLVTFLALLVLAHAIAGYSTPSARTADDASARQSSMCTACSMPRRGSCWAGWAGRSTPGGRSK
jgi:hypothetical protein